jgi:hypothetical protein
MPYCAVACQRRCRRVTGWKHEVGRGFLCQASRYLRNPTRLCQSEALIHLAGLTDRQVGFWVGKTTYTPTYANQRSGGYHRSFTRSEVEVAATRATYLAAATVGN